MDYLENRTFDEIQKGDSASLTRILTARDIELFALVTGDVNPVHMDPEYAKGSMFHQVIGHGMWGCAILSTVLGTELPGPGTIYISQTTRFRKPIAIGDAITATVRVTDKKPEKRRVILACECSNQRGEMVIEGETEVIALAEKIRRPRAELPDVILTSGS